MSNKIGVIGLSKLIILLLLLSLTGCAATAHNLKATDNMSEKKILAGRILFYENNEPTMSSRFIVYFNKNGDNHAQVLEPDEDGYVYVPVSAGQYNFASVKVSQTFTGTFKFYLPVFPSVTVHDNDSVVNFGTLHIKFTQSAGSKTSAALVGVARAYVKIEHTPNYDVTRPAIVTKIGTKIGTAMPVTDGKVSFLKRAQNAE